MSKSRHTEAEMIAALKQVEAVRKVEDVARKVGESKHTDGRCEAGQLRTRSGRWRSFTNEMERQIRDEETIPTSPPRRTSSTTAFVT
jgi:hypothetical protein